jgi:alpha-aminoadipate/glutamate carrier protein LysW
MIKCLECDAEIKIPSDSIEGEIVTCPDCGASYELVKSAGGFNIKPAQVVGEDWGQ